MSYLGEVHCLEQSVCMSTHHILVVAAGTRSKVLFGIERRIHGEGKAMTPKQQPQRAKLTSMVVL